MLLLGGVVRVAQPQRVRKEAAHRHDRLLMPAAALDPGVLAARSLSRPGPCPAQGLAGLW